jgi:hypothetical protein
MGELLERGPVDPVLQARWSVRSEFIRGGDLCDAVAQERGSEVQTRQFQSDGECAWMFRNPFFCAGRARGGREARAAGSVRRRAS